VTSSIQRTTSSVVVVLRTDDAGVSVAQIAFHLLAGATRVIVECRPDLRERFASLCGGDPRVAFDGLSDERVLDSRDTDWLIVARPGEFWWPRAGSLTELLDAIPRRYHTVNAFVRPLVVAAEDDSGNAVGRAVARDVRPSAQPDVRIRPVHRIAMARWLEKGDGRPRPGDPLRGWYPLEVLTLPPPGTPPMAVAAVESEIANGALVADTRLRDVLAPLRRVDGDALGPFDVPGVGVLTDLPRPSLADEAAYAVDVAGVGESELDAVERQLAELERRMATLESDLWRRITTRLARVLPTRP